MTRNASSDLQPDVDVAIVGGGVSGLYSGWRLMTADPASSPILSKWTRGGRKLRVTVIEGSGRLGGRLLSARPPTMPKVTCELGGMRYVSSQTLARSLIENELKMARHEQVVDTAANLAYLREHRLRSSDLGDAAKLPYRLRWAEQQALSATSPAPTLIGWAAEQLLPGVSSLSGDALRSFLHQARIDGQPLHRYGFWNLLARVLSPEAHELAIKTIGYDCLGSNANAADLLAEYFDFTPGVKYYLLNEGYESLPWQLEARFKAAGGEVLTEAWVSGFDAITLADGSTGVEIRYHDGRPALKARAIVMAMPRRSIRLLRPEGPVLDPARAPAVQSLLDAVEGVPLFKLFMVYPNAWWQAVGVSQGRSLTDLPLRQCYYWGAEPTTKIDPDSGHAAIMAYNDATSVSFWGGLRQRPLGPNDTRPQHFRGARAHGHGHAPAAFGPSHKATRSEHPYRRNWRSHRAPDAMVAEMHRQLKQMHGLLHAPEPIDAAYMDWADDPYGGAVHFWNPGYRSEQVLSAMTQPIAGFPAYVCGEAYSTNQTWVEGALQTAEIVLQQRLQLLAPTWVTPNG